MDDDLIIGDSTFDGVYDVYLWPGAGYGLDKFRVSADSAETSLEVLSKYLIDKGLKCYYKTDEEHHKDCFENWKFDNKDKSDDEYDDECESNDDMYIYIDGTMCGAKYPIWILCENMKIEEEKGMKESKKVLFSKIMKENNEDSPKSDRIDATNGVDRSKGPFYILEAESDLGDFDLNGRIFTLSGAKEVLQDEAKSHNDTSINSNFDSSGGNLNPFEISDACAARYYDNIIDWEEKGASNGIKKFDSFNELLSYFAKAIVKTLFPTRYKYPDYHINQDETVTVTIDCKSTDEVHDCMQEIDAYVPEWGFHTSDEYQLLLEKKNVKVEGDKIVLTLGVNWSVINTHDVYSWD